MAIVYSYPKVTAPLATDVLLLTDTTVTAGKRKNKTKSIAMSDVATYVVDTKGAITGSGTISTIPLYTGTKIIGDSIVTQTGTSRVNVLGDLSVQNQTTLNNTLNVIGASTLSSLTVNGASALNTLNVSGNSTFSNAATFSQGIIVNADSTFGADVDFDNGDININNTSTLVLNGPVKDSTTSLATAGKVLVSDSNSKVVWTDPTNIGGNVNGTGTTNYITKWQDTDTIEDSIIFDNGSKVAVGHNAPVSKFEIKGDSNNQSLLSIREHQNSSILNVSDLNDAGVLKIGYRGLNQARVLIDGGQYSTGTKIELYNNSNTLITRLPTSGNAYINSGNLGIGTTSPTTKLDLVDGRQRIVGSSNTDGAELGPELGTTASGTGWSGTSLFTGYTHTTGLTDPLTSALNAVIGKNYIVQLAFGPGSQGIPVDFSFGGFSSQVSRNGDGPFYIQATTTDPFVAVPDTSFVGPLEVSIKEVITQRKPQFRLSGSNSSAFIDFSVIKEYNTGVSRNILISENAARNVPRESDRHFSGGRSLANTIVIGTDNAGERLIKGASAVYIGRNAGALVERADRGVFIGNNSGSSMTPSDQGNVFIGSATGEDLVTGNYNTFIGVSSGSSLTEGNGNTLVGGTSGTYLRTGINNASVGTARLSANSSYNAVLLGGYGISDSANPGTFEYNVMLGYKAGNKRSGGPWTGVSRGIFIGRETYGLNDNSYREIVIGDGTVGLGDNTTSIGGTYTSKTVLYGNLGVGTTSPSYKLTVESSNGLKLQDSGTYLQVFKSSGSTFLNTGTSGGTIYIGAPAANTTNLHVQGDVESSSSSSGLILKSPNGTRYRVQVDNSGNLTTTAI